MFYNNYLSFLTYVNIFTLGVCFMRAFPLITNFKEKNVYSESQISNIVLVEYFILLGKKKLAMWVTNWSTPIQK